MSRQLLKEHFDFSKEDYQAYVKKYGELVIFDDGKCTAAKTGKLSKSEAKNACGPASPTDIAGWKTINGKVAVNLPAERIKQIQNFKQERTIDEAVKKIVDPFLRETVKKDLTALATGDAQTRMDAAARMENLEAATFDDAEAVRNSVRAMAQSPLNKQNATMQILAAKVDLERAVNDKHNAFVSDVNALGDKKNVNNQSLQKKVAEYESRLQKVIDAAGGIDTQTGKRLPNAKINRMEAARANSELAKIYRALGKEDKADQREMLSRFYQVDDGERNTMEFKLGKPRVSLDGSIHGGGFFSKYKTAEIKAAPPNVPPPSLPSGPPQKKELSEDPFKRETKTFEKSFKVVEQRFGGRRTQINTEQGTIKGYERNYQIEGSLRPESVLTEKFYESKTESGKKKPQRITIGRETTIIQTKQGPELNRAGTTRASGTSGVVAAAEFFNNNFPIIADYFTEKSLTERLKREKIGKEVFLRDNYPVPPEPKDLPRIKLRLERDLGKEKAAQVMKNIEEMSYAAHGSK